MKVLIILLFSLNVFARSGDRGNGADASVCRGADGEIVKASLYDYDQGAQRRLHSLIPENIGLDKVEKYLNNFFLSYEKFDRKTKGHLHSEGMNLFRAIRKHLETKEEWIGNDYRFTNGKISNLEDSEHDEESYECPMEQFVIRKEREVEEDPIYKISAKILAKVPNSHIIGLVIHEVFYHYFKSIQKIVESGDRIEDSRKIRYLVQLISHFGVGNYADELIGKLTLRQFLYLTKKVDITNQLKFTMELVRDSGDILIASKYPIKGFNNEEALVLTTKYQLVVIDKYGKLLESESALRGGSLIALNEGQFSSKKVSALNIEGLKPFHYSKRDLKDIKSRFDNYLSEYHKNMRYYFLPFSENVVMTNSNSKFSKKLILFNGLYQVDIGLVKVSKKRNHFVVKIALGEEPQVQTVY